MIYVGTSGFSYDDWVGAFYPPGTGKPAMLGFYAGEFNTCEINASYYAIPSARTLQSMVRRTGEGFLFTIKAHQSMTHEKSKDEAPFRQFREALKPLVDAGKFGCVLAQFPYSFHRNAENAKYLQVFKERLADLPVVIEFRNARWLVPEVFAWLEKNELGFCCVDEPPLPNLIPPVAKATSKIAYVRFHGRNAKKWWQHEQAYERYDYTYSEEELQEWVPRIRELEGIAETTFVYANNHWQGQAVQTARQLRLLLD